MGAAPPPIHKILILGAESSGKTSVLNYMIQKRNQIPSPTFGHNKIFYDFNNVRFEFWDVGGSKQNTFNWQQYYQNTSAIIFVVDASNLFDSKMNESKQCFKQVIENTNEKSKIIVFGNKQDLPQAMNTSEIYELLDLSNVGNRDVKIFETSTKNQKGMLAEIQYLYASVTNQ
ncbi:ADP-ribosylation_factor 1 [Hexamita inflata]|uniref:ADP-ribosylation factor 1 n=1 Tax=Hexamita inflata TaxID=28002 RepID=A0AA86RIL6_9EUKA|nr:ADP-ribosylation factor 1 [Hexamita inflata]